MWRRRTPAVAQAAFANRENGFWGALFQAGGFGRMASKARGFRRIDALLAGSV